MNQVYSCQTCETIYNIEDSTANKDKILFCSEACENISDEWLRQGNQMIEAAKQENPAIFARTSLTQEQNEAMETFKKLGVKFSSSNLSNNISTSNYIEKKDKN